MDIFQEKRKQQYLILAIIGMVLIAIGILSYDRFSEKSAIMPIVETNQYRKPVINWAVFEDPQFKELQLQ